MLLPVGLDIQRFFVVHRHIRDVHEYNLDELDMLVRPGKQFQLIQVDLLVQRISPPCLQTV